jgi:hypothetical protein
MDSSSASSYDPGPMPDDGGMDEGPPPDDSGGYDDASAALADEDGSDDASEDDMASGFDSLGAYVGDTGFSIPEVWKLLNGMKPMSKAQADAVLKTAIDVTDWAAHGLSGSDSTKAGAHAEALRNTRASIANASDDPLSDPDAGGVRTMVAQGFTYANTLANTNAMNAEHLSALWGDLKDNAVSLPGKIYDAASGAVAAVGSGLKWIAIGGGVLIALVGGVFIYRKVRA